MSNSTLKIRMMLTKIFDKIGDHIQKPKFLLISFVGTLLCQVPQGVSAQVSDTSENVTFMRSPENKSLDIFIDGEYFSSYRYESTWKKPLLYPLTTKSGLVLTRGYPIQAAPGERYDHPHHVG